MFGDSGLITLAAVTLLAAVVNGGLGYGFSSITVPVALIFYANRILNPAHSLSRPNLSRRRNSDFWEEVGLTGR
jgi:uncharacterized membrane protein YfcA